MRLPRPVVLPAALAGVGVAAASIAGVLAAAAVPALAATRSVEVRDDAYAPAAAEIAAGDTVRWTWVGDGRHSVTAPGVFDSHPRCTALTPEACGTSGTTFSWTSEAPGTIEYGCRVHPEMRGTLTVTERAPSPSPTPAPSPSPSAPATSSPPSPEPSRSPSPSPPPPRAGDDPTAAEAPSPSPSRRTATGFGVGEGTEVPASPTPGERGVVAPPVVSDASPEPLEPFPAPPSPTTASPDPVADDVVAVAPPGGAGREAARAAGVVAVAVSLLTFGRVVLFGRPWE